jgi:L-ascorbate metabolism protein UlaG (beta-lactamase superfamily)
MSEGQPTAERRSHDGPLALTWAGHATVLIELAGLRILTDPVLRNRVGPLRRIAAPVSATIAQRIDVVLLSHVHADHADPASLRRLRDATVLAPGGAGRWLARRGLRRVHELRPGEETEVGAVHVAATPAAHGGRRSPLGVRAEALGFLVRGPQALYFAGDTDLFEGMSELPGPLDAALLPIGGWGPTVGVGHLDPERAAIAAARIGPRVVVPIHWGTFALPAPLRARVDPMAAPRRFEALAARAAPRVEVRVLAQGERLELSPRAAAADGERGRSR